MTQQPKTRFTGIFIPVEILELTTLSPREIILLSWIDALYDEEYGGCWASNEYLASKLQVEIKTIEAAITKFYKLELIKKISCNGRQRVIKALIGKIVDREQTPRNLGVRPPENKDPSITNSKEENDDEKGDDDDRKKQESKKEFTKDDLFFAANKLNKDWTSNEIESAYKKYRSYQGGVTDPVRYCESIIDKLRLNQSNAEIKAFKKETPIRHEKPERIVHEMTPEEHREQRIATAKLCYSTSSTEKKKYIVEKGQEIFLQRQKEGLVTDEKYERALIILDIYEGKL